ncbi:acyltransferase family protein [Microbacterium sp. YY-03]|uniref:acyltransferase family protein n=1 Tax=Microbacterium sp. YY-03 TaxID=3421636 RepID=UPI003D16F963
MPTPQRLDIQGLRALAVALVVIFHLAPAVVPGGYIGVDVFFVISGFLITSHLLREVDRTGSIKLSEFWARRIRRLLPAGLLVLVVSAAAVLFLLPEAFRQQNLIEIFLASIYVVNWNYAANAVDYLGADTTGSIAQHYWSLSVEEQFYIVWPILILAAAWFGRRVIRADARRVIVVTLLLVFTVSFVFSVFETARSQPSAYFITTTRAWEFAAGALVGLLPFVRLRQSVRVILSWGAVAAVAASALLFDSGTEFPGWIAIVPVAATAWLLYVGDIESNNSPQYLARAGWVQRLGDLSYSIYLWHWPIIVVFVALRGAQPGWKGMVVLLLVTIVLAELTKRFVEDPVRRAPGIIGRPLPTYVAMVSSIVVIAAATLIPSLVWDATQQDKREQVAAQILIEDGCFGAYAVQNGCDPDDVPTGLITPAISAKDGYTPDTSSDACRVESIEGQHLTTCEFNTGTDTMVLFGDSHAAHLIRPLVKLTDERDQTLAVHSRTGCSGFPGMEGEQTENRRLCSEWANSTLAAVASDPDVSAVVLSVRTMLTAGDRDLAISQINMLQEAGKSVYVFRTVPGMPDQWPVDFGDRAQFAPECVERRGQCDWTPGPWEDWLVAAAEEAGATVLDTWEMVCPDGVCRAVIGGTIVYFDESHLTRTFAETLTPWLRSEIRR